MSNTYYQVYIQTVFAVKYRHAILEKSWATNLYAVIGNLINESNCKTIIINGHNDHIHCFFGLNPAISISKLMQNVKAKSSKYINDHSLTKIKFEWQTGYGAFSYSKSQIDNVYNYILSQEVHHKKVTFKKEYLQFLEKYQIDFDERYIFKDLI
jgi:putative transposase